MNRSKDFQNRHVRFSYLLQANTSDRNTALERAKTRLTKSVFTLIGLPADSSVSYMRFLPQQAPRKSHAENNGRGSSGCIAHPQTTPLL